MSNWNIVRQKVNDIKEPDTQNNIWRWKSQTRALYKIITQAEAWNIPSDWAEEAKLSNLYEIIVEANKAIANDNKDRLIELFTCAKNCTNSDLRITLRGHKLPEIQVKKVISDNDTHYILDLTQKQYDRMSLVLKNRFRLQFDE